MEFHVSEWSRLLIDTIKSSEQYLYLNGRMDYEMINSFLKDLLVQKQMMNRLYSRMEEGKFD